MVSTAGSKSFADMGRRQQLAAVRASARAALDHFDMPTASLKLVYHDFNTTFRVRTDDGEDAALRINLNSAYGAEAVEAEAEWVALLARDGVCQVPTPRPTIGGGFVAPVACRGFDQPLPAVMYSWLPGRDIGERCYPVQFRALGETMAALHDHTTRPSAAVADITARRPTLDSTLLDDPDRIRPGHSALSQATHRFLVETMDHVDETAAPIYLGPAQLIHGDLHHYNLKWSRAGLGVFDFDDCGLAHPLLDLAISTYYVRDSPALEEALFDGYTSRRELPAHTRDQFEALVAARNLTLLNFVLGTVTAGYNDFIPTYVERTVKRLRRYISTGTFSLSTDQ